jgi:hypothetical protein
MGIVKYNGESNGDVSVTVTCDLCALRTGRRTMALLCRLIFALLFVFGNVYFMNWDR